MGVHDYICFVERNGQTLHGLHKRYVDDVEEDEQEEEEEEEVIQEDVETPESFYGVIVIIPEKYGITDILRWELTKFREFPIMRCTYSWDSWYFDDFPSYYEILHGTKKWYEQTIWSDKSIPNSHLVTFDPGMYQAFVLGNVDPDEISNETYKTILGNRGLEMPRTKKLAFDYIVNCGEDNISEFYDIVLQPLPISHEYETLRTTVLNRDLFTKVYSYKLENTPCDLHMSRLGVLIKDNVRSDNILKPLTKQLGVGEHTFCQEYNPGGTSIYLFRFVPEIKTEIDDKLLHGCVICGKNRCKSRYTCIDHYNDPVDLDRLNMLISESINELIVNLRLLSTYPVPEYLHIRSLNLTLTKI